MRNFWKDLFLNIPAVVEAQKPDRYQAKLLTYLLFVSYFASQSKGIKIGDGFYIVCCVT